MIHLQRNEQYRNVDDAVNIELGIGNEWLKLNTVSVNLDKTKYLVSKTASNIYSSSNIVGNGIIDSANNISNT